ncbi:uncharacterized protein LOC112505868 [Cynara cardunculus var. scolymus]|uniref:uncharacterized protein LOC112505868 n=1 Tax=Cynara cardunculus var. scolymus TaxID=59895 RepID=UPI000D628636|nr:uncharacterized protein LOC112505868 [Cynara cardunculus var. scolymus]
MGAGFSSKTSKAELTKKTIRVVHLNGSLDDYQDPATVDQVTSNFPDHFLCSPIEILQAGLVPLKLNHQLTSGQIYFIFPNSTLKFNSSPVDLTSLTRKLTNIAKTSHGSTKSVPAASLSVNRRLRNPQARKCGEKGKKSMLKSRKLPLWKPNLTTIIEG